MRIIFVFIAVSSFFLAQSQNDKVRLARLKKLDSIESVARKDQKERDSFIPLNLIDRPYKYLDDDFNIIIDSVAFKKVINYNPYGKVETYKDSLMRILIYELKSTSGGGIAFHRILYKWEKLGFYIWKSEKETKSIANDFGFKHPYRFYKYLKNEHIHTEEKYQLLNEIKAEIRKVDTAVIEIKPYEKFLRYAFKINPKRQQAMEAYLKAHSKHKH